MCLKTSVLSTQSVLGVYDQNNVLLAECRNGLLGEATQQPRLRIWRPVDSLEEPGLVLPARKRGCVSLSSLPIRPSVRPSIHPSYSGPCIQQFSHDLMSATYQ